MRPVRVSTTIDTNRLAQAVSQPGIDPRTWVSLAYVTAVHVDPGHGYFVDVVTMPDRWALPARVGTEYAGNGFGAFFPLLVDDEVLVEAPSGNPAAGLVVTKRLWSGGDPPPAELADHPDDVLVLARAGTTVRIATLGAGTVVIEARGSGQVKLGAEAASRGVARLDDETKIDLTTLQACLDTRYQLRPSPPPLVLSAFVGGVPTHITTASDKVKST